MEPFRSQNLGAFLEKQKGKMLDAVSKLSNEELVANDLAVLEENLYQQFFIEPLELLEEDFSKRSIKQGKIKVAIDPLFRRFERRDYVEVDGIIAEFYYPFIGDERLFECQPSVFRMGFYPDISISRGYVSFKIERTLKEMESEGSKDKLLFDLEEMKKSIQDGIHDVNNNVNGFNAQLKHTIAQALTEKKKKVEQFFEISKMLEVPIEKKRYSQEHIPLERNIVPTTKHYKKEDYYCISDSDYEDVVSTIKHTLSTYERTPSSYKHMNEEDLRNTILASLNATYKGDATGETFRNGGKTDICIERDNRAAFVAECKMWKGQKEIEPAIQQLDGYLTWRDCKTALIIFVKNKDFLHTLETAEKALGSIKQMRTVLKKDKNEFECIYLSESNPGQQIRIRVMLFNLYSA